MEIAAARKKNWSGKRARLRVDFATKIARVSRGAGMEFLTVPMSISLAFNTRARSVRYFDKNPETLNT